MTKRIDYKAMLRPNRVPTNDHLSRVGVFAKHLRLATIEERLTVESYSHFLYFAFKRTELALLYYLLVTSGVRVSELLRLDYSSLFRGHSFIISGVKGSNSRIIDCAGFEKYFAVLAMKNGPVFFGLNYHAVYREFKKRGIEVDVVGNQRKAVTHMFRHTYVEDVQKVSGNVVMTKEVIGHKRAKSTKHYLSKKVKK